MTMLYDPLLRRDFLHMTRNRLLERVTAPVEEPVTLDEAKLYLRVDTTKDDTLIGDLIVAARMVAEGWLRRSLISQSWKMAFDGGIAGSVGLAMGPVSAITGVTVVNQDGGSRTLDGGSYWLNAARSALVTGGAVMGFRVEVTYVAGYGADTDAVPRPIKQGMLSHIGAMYDHRGEDGGMALPEQAMALYAPFREVHV